MYRFIPLFNIKIEISECYNKIVNGNPEVKNASQVQFITVPNTKKPILQEKVIQCGAVLKGDEEQFGIGCEPINKNEPNRRSDVLKALGEEGTKAVCKIPKFINFDGLDKKAPEASLMRLCNETGTENVPQLLGEGMVDYDPNIEMFNTGQQTNKRPYMLVEDVSDYADHRLYYNLPISEQINYTKQELRTIYELLQKTGIAYKDYDDAIWVDKKTSLPIVRLIDFSEEKSMGIPLSVESIMSLAKSFSYLLQPSHEEAIESNVITNLREQRTLVEQYASKLKKHGQLNSEANSTLSYTLNEKNIQKYLNLLKKEIRKKREAEKINQITSAINRATILSLKSKEFHFTSAEDSFVREYRYNLTSLSRLKGLIELDFDSAMELFYQRRNSYRPTISPSNIRQKNKNEIY